MTQAESTSIESIEYAYAEESKKLKRVIHRIEAEQIRLEKLGHTPTADRSVAAALRTQFENDQVDLTSALEQPYFGRIDFVEVSNTDSESEIRTVYIGSYPILKENVVPWTAPVARLYYTNDSGYRVSKDGVRIKEDRHISVRIDLRRFLRIRNQQLIDLNDLYRRALPTPTKARTKALGEVLSKTGDEEAQLQVVIETIEPDQYEAIANQEDPALIVQGAPGSGKSEIGLHRIAYLLSPFNDIDSTKRPTPETTLFIGPSKAFLDYASDVLPTLGVREHVRQITFQDWLQDQQTAQLQLRRVGSDIWNELLQRGELKRFNERIESFKGSLAMADALDKHIDNLTRSIRKKCRNISSGSTQLDNARRVNVTRDEFAQCAKAALTGAHGSAGLNNRRQTFLRLVARLVLDRSYSGRGVATEDAERQQRAAEGWVAAWCAEAWPRFDARTEYAAATEDLDTLRRMTRNSLSLEEAQAIRESTRRMLDKGFLDSDIGAVTYLDHLLNGTIDRRYRHIVVDEAQDISPIEFKLLSLASTNNWFTVLGDIAQRLTPYRGISQWRTLERVLGRADTRVQYAQLSYRANKHITRFNNRILRLFEMNLPAPTPFDRGGSRVEYHRHSSNFGMYRCVVDDLEQVRSLPDMAGARIAILARDRRNLNRFRDYCVASGRHDVLLIDQDLHSTARTVLARIPDVRGLEYDAVIVLGVNDSFADTTFNQKLLYLATTRAKHYLAIHWSGAVSPILKRIYSGGVREIDRRVR